MFFTKTPKLIQKLFPSLTWKINSIEKEVFITFDDGPTPEFTQWLLNLLNSLNIKSTFFCIGEKAKRHPNIISEILKQGHSIGNHTFSHNNGWVSTTDSYIKEIKKCSNFVNETNLFRPPYGKIYPWQIKKIIKNYKIIMWDILSYDFKKSQTSEKFQKNILNNIEKGSIIVFHDNKNSEKILKENLEDVLKKIRKKGFSFSTL